MPTLIADPDELSKAVATGSRVTVEGDAYRHLIRALRLEEGDSLRVVDGQGNARFGRIETVERRTAEVALGEEAPDLEPDLCVELVVAQLRAERARWLVEKATELGVRRIVWMRTERSQHDWTAAKLERFERVARSAVEQCGRARLPELVGPLDWTGVLSMLEAQEPDVRALIAHPSTSDDNPGGEVAAEAESPGGMVRILIGPEGGFTEPEAEQAQAAGCLLVDLGERILRVETAALALASRFLTPERSLPLTVSGPKG